MLPAASTVKATGNNTAALAGPPSPRVAGEPRGGTLAPQAIRVMIPVLASMRRMVPGSGDDPSHGTSATSRFPAPSTASATGLTSAASAGPPSPRGAPAGGGGAPGNVAPAMTVIAP